MFPAVICQSLRAIVTFIVTVTMNVFSEETVLLLKSNLRLRKK